VGYGKTAMLRTGLALRLWEELHEEFPHPHNAYLQILLDSGWIGLTFVLPFYFLVMARLGMLLFDSRDPVFGAAGGAAVALVGALMIAAVGSQTFYPREGSVGMWCAIALGLRISLERSKAQARRIAPAVRSHLAARPVRLAAPEPAGMRRE
jgi:O-antigen ligase